MTENESTIIKEAIVIILHHIRFDGELSPFTYSEQKRLENIKKKLIKSEEVNANERRQL